MVMGGTITGDRLLATTLDRDTNLDTTMETIMKIRILLGLTIVGLATITAQAQPRQIHHTLKGRGVVFGLQAVMQGQRVYTASSSSGDGDYVQFEGMIQTSQGTARFVYGGYVQLGAFPGIIETPQRKIFVKVLDNTGGKMIIYSGQESLGAPDILGEFVCNWQ